MFKWYKTKREYAKDEGITERAVQYREETGAVKFINVKDYKYIVVKPWFGNVPQRPLNDATSIKLWWGDQELINPIK